MEDHEKIEEVPSELYAPMGNVTFENPNEKKEEDVEILSYKDVKLEYAKKPFNTKKFITTIVSLIVITMFILAFYLYEKNNKNILRLGTSNIIGKVENSVYGIKNSKFLSFNTKKPFRTSFILSFDTLYDETKLKEEEISFLKTINDVKVSETLDFDYANQQFTHNFKSTYLGGNILEVYGNGYDDGITYKVKDILGKYIFYPIDNLKRFYMDSDKDKKELDEIIQIVFKTVYSNIKESDLKRENIKLKIGENNIKVKDISLTMNNQYIQNILNNTINSLRTNNTFIEKTMSYTNLTSTRLQEILEAYQEEIKATNFTDENIVLHIYAKGITNKIVGYKLTFKNSELEYLEYKNIPIIKLYENQKLAFSYEKKMVEKDEYEYNIIYFDNKLKVHRIQKDDSILYEYTLTTDKNVSYTGNLSITDEESKQVKDGYVKLSITKLNQDQEELESVYITLNYSIKTMEKMNLYEDENRVEEKTLTEEDKKEIKKRIENTEYFDLVKKEIESYKNFLKKES